MTGPVPTVEPYQRISRGMPRLPRRKRTSILILTSDFFNWGTLGLAVSLFLLARLRLLGELAPFGLAVWIAAGRLELKRMVFYAAVALFAVGSQGSTELVLKMLLSMAVFLLLLDRLSRYRIPLPLLAGISVLAGSFPGFWGGGFHAYDLVLVGLETVMAMFAVTIFSQIASEPLHGGALEKSVEGITSWIVFSGLLLLSLIQEGFYLPLVAGIAARLIVLWASFLYGPGMGAAAGALLGFLLGIQGNVLVWLSTLTFAGFLSGLFKPYGRLAQSLGFIMGIVSLSFYLSGPDVLRSEAVLTGAAIVFFLLGPVLPKRIQVLAPFLRSRPVSEGEEVRDLTATRIKDYALVFRELSEAFRQAAAVSQKSEPPLAALAEEISRRVCQSCPALRRCWDKDLRRTYNAMLRVLSDLDGGQQARDVRTPEFFQKYCRRSEEFMRTLSQVRELKILNGKWEKKINSLNEFVSLQLSGLSQVLLDLCKDVNTEAAERRRVDAHFFHIEIGVAQAAKGSEEICGDYYSYLELRDGKQAFIVSDGMGNGNKAYLESSSTVNLVEHLLLAGFKREQIIKTVNTILQLRSPDESFATLDVMLFDAQKGEAEFLKIGAAPSFIRQNGQVHEVRSPSVPLGILNEVELKPVRIPLEEEGLIVMVTDGIYDVALKQPEWLKLYLMETTLEHPQVLADEILHQARTLSESPLLRDDVTVLVCRARRIKYKVRDFVTDCK